jgi:hypothetical protein
MRSRVTLTAVALALVASVAAGWFFESRYASPGGSVSGDAYRVRVTRDGRLLAAFDLAALRAVGTETVIAQGSKQQGPRLVDVLRRAGVDQFASVTVIGPGTRDSGVLDLPSAKVSSDTVLSVAKKRGTVKIAGPTISAGQRVRDVTEIQVR